MTTLIAHSPTLTMAYPVAYPSGKTSIHPNGHGIGPGSTFDSLSTDLPTPDSAAPGSFYHQPQVSYPHPSSPSSQHQYSPSHSIHYSPSPSKQIHPHQYGANSYSPSHAAGPSTYKRTPASNGEQVMMDGIERDVREMVVDEGDGRVGVDDPCT